MTTPRTLRRATLNGAGLALLASLACATPAAAQSLNAADTLAYIKERCEDFTDPTFSSSATAGPVTLSGSRLSLQLSHDHYDDVRYVFASFDLRRVDIGLWGVSENTLQLRCGQGYCIDKREDAPPGPGESGRTRRSYKDQSYVLACREADRVVNALRHLQRLLGGRIADPVDPFAN